MTRPDITRPAVLLATVAALVLACPAVNARPAVSGSGASPLEQRVRALEDRAAIETLITGAYAQAIDRTDNRALSELFTADGEFASDWLTLAELPPLMAAVFGKIETVASGAALRPMMVFSGRAAIAGYMMLVVTGTPVVSVEGGQVVARYAAPASPGAALPPPPPGGGNPMMARFVSMKHIITNPVITLAGDRASATSYWIEVATGKDGQRTILGGGTYSDDLVRDDGQWRFRRRIIHNYDPSAAGPAG